MHNSLLRKAEREYYKINFAKNKNDSRKTWKLINNVTNRNKNSDINDYFNINGQIVSDPKVITEEFNKCFNSIGPSLAYQITCDIKPMIYMPEPNPASFFVLPTDVIEMKKIIEKIKPGTSPGWDDIPIDIIKIISEFLLEPLVELANISFSQGIFPDPMKLSKVIALYKAKEHEILTNHRPISLLIAISKMFESLIHKRLFDFIVRRKLLNKFQFAFRPSLSTEHATMFYRN